MKDTQWGLLLSEGIAAISILSVWDLIHPLHQLFLAINAEEYTTKERILATFLGTFAGLYLRLGMWLVMRKPAAFTVKKKIQRTREKILQAAE